MITGGNGIIKQAKEAKEKNKQATVEEQIRNPQTMVFLRHQLVNLAI